MKTNCDDLMGVKLPRMLALMLRALLFIAVVLFSSVSVVAQHVEGNSAHAQDMMKFLSDDLMLFQPQFWCIVAFMLLVALSFWKFGYRLLLWLRGCSVHVRIAVALLVLLVAGFLGCVKVDRVGWWFTIPVAFSIMMLCLVAHDLLGRLLTWWKLRSGIEGKPLAIVGRQQNLKLLAKVVLLVWGLGWMLYFIPVTAVHGSHVGAEALYHPAACAIQMFAFHMESVVIDADIVNNYDVLKGILSVVCFAASVCTVVAVIGLVASRLMAYLHLMNFSVNKKYNHLYLFFGINDASTLLAKDILDDEHGDPHAMVVFVETALNGEKDSNNESHAGWKSIMNMFTHRRATFVKAQEGKRRALAISSADIASIDINSGVIDLWGTLGLDSIKRLLGDKHGLGSLKGNGQLHVFFLSEDRHDNVLGAVNVTHDELLRAAIDDESHKFSIDIYCHVADLNTGRMIEDAVINNKMNMHILNYSQLAIEGLKHSVENQPVNFVDFQTIDGSCPGAAMSSFVSLVIGFGETGQQALKFLYEYGAFVSGKTGIGSCSRSDFVCHVIDKEIDSRIASFGASHPSVPFVYKNLSSSSRGGRDAHGMEPLDGDDQVSSSMIRFFNCDFRSTGFYEEVMSPIVENLNYVVVALGDAQLNISVAIDVLRHVRRHRSNLDNFKILVRGYDMRSFDFINAIGGRYNSLAGCGTENEIIEIFGYNEQLCTYDLVVQNKYLMEAKQYLSAYNILHGYDGGDPTTGLDAWDLRHYHTLGNGVNFSWDKLSELKRKEGQDRSNAVHAMTKLEILRKVLNDNDDMDRIRDLAERMFVVQDGNVVKSSLVGEKDKIHYPGLSQQENKLMLNLAITEHLRWMASHEMMGYTVNNDEHKCDETHKKHNALRPWQELDQESLSYKVNNFGVAETTLKLRFFGEG